jgi:hypothetical protein
MPSDLAGLALLIAVLVAVAVAAFCMSWSGAQDPKLTFLALLMLNSPRTFSGNTTDARVPKAKCRY